MKKGMPSSYLGVTTHFFSRQDHRRHKVTLTVKRMPHPHNAENIREILNEVLQEWCIPSTKVGVVITDTGSDMVKAFRQDYFAGEGDDADEEDESDIDMDLDSMDELDDAEEPEIAFQFSGKHLSCFAHTLQLVVLNFSEDESLKRILKRAFALVKKVNKSSKATKKLLLFCRKKTGG